MSEDQGTKLEEVCQDKRSNQGVINLDLERDHVGHDGGNSSENPNEPIRAPWSPSMVARSLMLIVLLRLLR